MRPSVETLAQIANDAGGFTFRWSDAEFPSAGFAVGIPGFEHQTAYLTPQSIWDYVLRTDVSAALNADAHRCLGTWRNGDTWYLDVSEVYANLASAIDAARKGNQRAVYDLAEGLTILVSPLPQEVPVTTDLGGES